MEGQEERRHGLELIESFVREAKSKLDACGFTLAGSGSCVSGPFEMSVHTDLGPPEDEKQINQDYVVGWVGRGLPGPGGIEAAFVLADGVTSSEWSEFGAKVACWKTLGSLVCDSEKDGPKERALRAIREAGAAIRKLGEEIESRAEAWRPKESDVQEMRRATWNYMLRRGRFLDTTVSVGWLDQKRLYFGGLGDGGGGWRCWDDSAGLAVKDEVLAECELSTQVVSSYLGPKKELPEELAYWIERSLPGRFLACFYTDGVCRGILNKPGEALDCLEGFLRGGVDNVARQYIAKVIRERRKDFRDNLSLAALRKT